MAAIDGHAWNDVALAAGTARIHQQVIGSGRSARMAPLKTRSSERTMFLPPAVVAHLTEHRARQLQERIAAGRPTAEGLVFVTERGLAVNGSWLTKRLQAATAAAGMKPLGMHSLRHGAASLMAAVGVHPSVAQAVLGHASSAMTLERYTHTTAAQQRQAVETVFAKVAGERAG